MGQGYNGVRIFNASKLIIYSFISINGSIKGVEMKVLGKTFLGLLATGVVIAGCSNSADMSTTAKAASPRYVASVVSGDTILTDTMTKQSWTNSDRGCKPIGSGSKAEITRKANNFCSSLNFGGHSDWRLGSVAEVTALEKQTDVHGIKLFYKNPMCQLVFAKKSDNTLTSVSTTNNSPVARVTGFKTPAGTRCVRNSG